MSVYRNLLHFVMNMSPKSAMFGMDLRLFGIFPLRPWPNLPLEQLLTSSFAEAAVNYVSIHIDRHSILAASTAARRAVDAIY